MIESVFIVLLIMAIIFQILSVYWEAWPFSILTSVLFLIITAASWNIQMLVVYQPFVNNTTVINGTYELASFSDGTLLALGLGLSIVNIILAVTFYWDCFTGDASVNDLKQPP